MGRTGLLPYEELVSFRRPPATRRVCPRELQLYALAVGAGAALPDRGALPFVYENGLIPLSSYYTILAWRDPHWLVDIGVSLPAMVHLAETLTVYAPPPVDGEVEVATRIVDVVDKGPGRGALLEAAFSMVDPRTGAEMAEARSLLYCRANGGVEGAPPARPRASPRAARNGAPDGSIRVPTRPDQAALYRLCGDMNPIHIDPEVAGQAGFERPLLHGLCTYSMVYFALLRDVLGGDQARIRRFDANFTGPVFPGDSLLVDYWREKGSIRFAVAGDQARPALSGELTLNP